MADDIDLELLNAGLRDFVPHNKALGITLVAATPTPPSVTVKMPWSERLVGNPQTQVMAGGAITTLLDACCGSSVYLRLRDPMPIATLDLRVDFLGRAPAHRDVFARAECYANTGSVAFVRGTAWVDDPEKPFATATATFALSTRGRAVTDEEIRKGTRS